MHANRDQQILIEPRDGINKCNSIQRADADALENTALHKYMN